MSLSTLFKDYNLSQIFCRIFHLCWTFRLNWACRLDWAFHLGWPPPFFLFFSFLNLWMIEHRICSPLNHSPLRSFLYGFTLPSYNALLIHNLKKLYSNSIYIHKYMSWSDRGGRYWLERNFFRGCWVVLVWCFQWREQVVFPKRIMEQGGESVRQWKGLRIG